MEPISVYLVDRATLFRDGIKRLLSDAGFVVKREASHLQDLLVRSDGEDVPNVVLTDIAASDPLFPQHLSALRDRYPDVRIVILTDELSPDRIAVAVQCGVDGYLLKDISVDALRQSLQLVVLGEKVMPADLATSVSGGEDLEARRRSHKAVLSKMSGRETEVLRYLLQGLSNKAIGNQLNISEGTVKVHLKGILKKINVRNRTQAVIWAMVNGIAGSLSPTEAAASSAPTSSGIAVSTPRPAALSGMGVAASKSALRVVIVEDELLVAMYIEQTVRDLGYEVIGPAGTLAEAKNLFETSDFDVAILDVRLRQGELIYPAIEILRERRIPFVFITAYGAEGLDRQFGRHPVLKKPFSQRELQRCIRNVVALQ